MSEVLREKLRVYESLHGYTKSAIEKSIKEIENSINESKDEAINKSLTTRKIELEKALIQLESFED